MKRALALSLSLCFAVNSAWAKVYSIGLDRTQFTSDYMIGTVVVSVIFPESNGAIDPNLNNWSDERQTKALSKIISGINWWTKQNPKSSLKFVFLSQTLTTPYEPITRPYYDESLWIPSVMSQLGYSGSRFDSTKNYVNNLRDQYNADWGYVIFVVDSQTDSNGKFADGLFAYSYLGGPFIVMTYDNDGYGIGNMDVVVAHETGHIFHALDEYAGASSPNDYSHGYFSMINGNHVYAGTANCPDSIMRGGLRWGLDNWARQMVGWRDNDSNGRDDILDPDPTVSLSNTPSAVSGGGLSLQGHANLNVLPRELNSNGYGTTTDTIVRVEYRLPSGDWTTASPVDGAFDSADENFRLDLSPSTALSIQSIKPQDVSLRVIRASSIYQGNSGVALSTTAVSSLDDAHAFPNPYKPNEDTLKKEIRFTGLTADSKVQIFTPVGEPVVVKEVGPGNNFVQWDAKNADGALVATGVYLYLITDPSGQTKKGKIAIIR